MPPSDRAWVSTAAPSVDYPRFPPRIAARSPDVTNMSPRVRPGALRHFRPRGTVPSAGRADPPWRGGTHARVSRMAGTDGGDRGDERARRGGGTRLEDADRPRLRQRRRAEGGGADGARGGGAHAAARRPRGDMAVVFGLERRPLHPAARAWRTHGPAGAVAQGGWPRGRVAGHRLDRPGLRHRRARHGLRRSRGAPGSRFQRRPRHAARPRDGARGRPPPDGARGPRRGGIDASALDPSRGGPQRQAGLGPCRRRPEGIRARRARF